MAATLTPNYGWTQPDVGGDASVWGTTLNDDLALIDAQVFQNEQATVMVGCITMYGGAVAPANWLLCQGQSLATTGLYAALFGIIGYAFGGSGANFSLPNLQAKFPIGSGAGMALGAIGGANTVALSAAMLPAHTHTITQVAHAHTASQPAHVHPDPGHTHTASEAPHSHTVPNVPLFTAGSGVPGGTGAQLGTQTTSTAQPAITVNAAVTGLQAAGGDAVTVNPTTPTGPTATGSVGSGAAVPTVPPFQAVNYIIRYQ